MDASTGFLSRSVGYLSLKMSNLLVVSVERPRIRRDSGTAAACMGNNIGSSDGVVLRRFLLNCSAESNPILRARTHAHRLPMGRVFISPTPYRTEPSGLSDAQRHQCNDACHSF